MQNLNRRAFLSIPALTALPVGEVGEKWVIAPNPFNHPEAGLIEFDLKNLKGVYRLTDVGSRTRPWRMERISGNGPELFLGPDLSKPMSI